MLKVDQIKKLADGQLVRIIGVDSDPTCTVLVVYVNHPDSYRSVNRSDLMEA